MLIPIVILVASYLFGAVPFGVLIAKAKGVDLFKVGSGNIGATNVGRVLGKKFGVLAFVLDFLKGAIPVAVAKTFLPMTSLWVLAGLLAFLGHLFPIYLKFKGGKGVATGAGVMAVLVPVPFAVALLFWVAVTVSSRYVSAGSIAAAFALVVARLLGTSNAFNETEWSLTAFCLVGAGMVVVKHRANLKRLLAGTENQIGDGSMRQTLLRGLHLCAVGLWCGSTVFFNFIAAVPIFDSFKEVVKNQPSDRTAFVRILPEDAPDTDKAALASGLAGSAVGPLFPRLFLLSALCALVAVPTANGLRRVEKGRVHDVRFLLCCVAAALVAAGWPLSDWVSRLRVERFHPDAEVAAAAKAAFGLWHLVSLASSGVTTLVVCVVLMLGARLPQEKSATV